MRFVVMVIVPPDSHDPASRALDLLEYHKRDPSEPHRDWQWDMTPHLCQPIEGEDRESVPVAELPEEPHCYAFVTPEGSWVEIDDFFQNDRQVTQAPDSPSRGRWSYEHEQDARARFSCRYREVLIEQSQGRAVFYDVHC